MQKFKYILDNLIGRCPSCYLNFLRFFCELACNPDHDKFVHPLEYNNILPPSEEKKETNDGESGVIRQDWALQDYRDPESEDEQNEDEEEEIEEKEKSANKVASKTVEVITKVRYFLAESDAIGFMKSCW